MGFIESMALLAALGGGAYLTVYYLIPAIQQMAYAPYYYMSQQQQQQPAPAPAAAAAPEPVTQDATIPDEALDDVTSDSLEEAAEEGAEKALEDAGLVKNDKKDKKKSSSSSTKGDSAYEKQKKRHDATVKSMDPKKDTRPQDAASRKAREKAAGFQTIVRYKTIADYLDE